MNRPALFLRTDGPPIQLVPSQPSRAHLLGVLGNDLQQIQKIGGGTPISQFENEFLESFKLICENDLKKANKEDQAVAKVLSSMWQLFNLLAGQQMVLKLALENILNFKTQELKNEMFGLCEVIVEEETSVIVNREEKCSPRLVPSVVPGFSPTPKRRGRGGRGGVAASKATEKLLFEKLQDGKKTRHSEIVYNSNDG